MMPAQRPATSFRFSTTGVPPAERLLAWNNAYGRSLSRRELEPTRRPIGSFHIEMTARLLGVHPSGAPGGSIVRMMVTAGGEARRAGHLLADGNDDIVLHMQRSGSRLVFQRGREAFVEAGGAIVTSNAEASRIVLTGPARFVCVAVPRRVMLTLAPRVEDSLVRPLAPNLAVLKLLATYLDAVEDDEALRGGELRGTVTAHIYDLCALAIGAARDAEAAAAGRGLRAARLQAVKADIAAHLGLEELSAEALARRHGVTPRYIHKLFELEGTTLSRFRLGQRLARAHGMLLSAAHDHLTISEIAYRAGFNDLSTFNREFRRRFGGTPSEIRSAARLAAGGPPA